MLMKLVITLLLCIFAVLPNLAQDLQTFHFDDLDSLQNLNEKPVMVFIHTDWCKYCEGMQKSMQTDEKLSHILQKSFYYVPFNAETQESVKLGSHTFKYVPKGPNTGYHELAYAIGKINNQLTYPTICFLNADYEIIYQYAGYLNARQIKKVLLTIKESL